MRSPRDGAPAPFKEGSASCKMTALPPLDSTTLATPSFVTMVRSACRRVWLLRRLKRPCSVSAESKLEGRSTTSVYPSHGRSRHARYASWTEGFWTKRSEGRRRSSTHAVRRAHPIVLKGDGAEETISTSGTESRRASSRERR